MIACEKCGRSPKDGHTIYRANEKGVRGRWRCINHLNQTAFENASDPRCQAIEDALNQTEGVTQ